MTNRERYKESLLFGQPDHIPLKPGGGREKTRKRWAEEGLPIDANYMEVLFDTLGIDKKYILASAGSGVDFRMIPQFEEKVLEHKNGHYIVQDWMGAITEISDEYDYTYIRSAKDFVTRKWHKFPVETHQDWEEIKKRYEVDAEARFPDDFKERCKKLNNDDMVVGLSINGPFWQAREWFGFENLCMKIALEPDFIKETMDFWKAFVTKILTRIVENLNVDSMIINEDMAYKAHSMISPHQTREFLMPSWKEWRKLLNDGGCDIVMCDSDGCIEELIPIWIESGINGTTPIEVAAHNDIVEFRKIYGKKMAYTGGIDKRCIAAGGEKLKNEVQRVVPPLLEEGGFIPSCDHGVPHDVSWPNFIDYSRQLAELLGWI